jgi:hypothetical protein
MSGSLSGTKSYQTQSTTVALDGVWIVRATLCIAAMETKQEIKGAVEKSGEGRMTLKLTDWIRNVSSRLRVIDMWLWHAEWAVRKMNCLSCHSAPLLYTPLHPKEKSETGSGHQGSLAPWLMSCEAFDSGEQDISHQFSLSRGARLSAIPAVIWAGNPNELCLSQRFPRNPFPLCLRTPECNVTVWLARAMPHSESSQLGAC